jgi:hypothetical protein
MPQLLRKGSGEVGAPVNQYDPLPIGDTSGDLLQDIRGGNTTSATDFDHKRSHHLPSF